jgi:hypothetical protein
MMVVEAKRKKTKTNELCIRFLLIKKKEEKPEMV